MDKYLAPAPSRAIYGSPGLPAALQAGQLGQHFAPAPSGATYGLAPSGATVGSPGLPAAGREFRALALPGTAQTGRSRELHLQHRLIDTTVKFELLIHVIVRRLSWIG